MVFLVAFGEATFFEAVVNDLFLVTVAFRAAVVDDLDEEIALVLEEGFDAHFFVVAFDFFFGGPCTGSISQRFFKSFACPFGALSESLLVRVS